jgi:hypothetical protein
MLPGASSPSFTALVSREPPSETSRPNSHQPASDGAALGNLTHIDLWELPSESFDS